LVAPVLIDVGPLPRLTNRNPVITWTVNEEAVFECALNDLDKFEWCGNGTKGEWKGKNLDKGRDHRIVVRVKDPQGNTDNLIDHTFVVGKYFYSVDYSIRAAYIEVAARLAKQPSLFSLERDEIVYFL
jgi:hypothetical protein